MQEPIHTEEYKGHKIEIHYDDSAFSPRSPKEFENMGTMVCFHGRYNLGDEDYGFHKGDYDSWEGLRKAILKEHGPCLIAPLYLYDHGGITISMGEFSCKWDSGQVGFIFVPYSTIRKEYSVKRISKQVMERAQSCLKGEVQTYDDYLTGNVYGFKVIEHPDTEDENEIDSCWGFYGDYEQEGGPLSEARSIVDHATDTFRNLIRKGIKQAEEEKKIELADKLDAALEHQKELNKELEFQPA